MTLRLRCSELPLNFICAGSARRGDGGELVIDEGGAPAGLGQAAHEGLATLVETGHVPWGETGSLAIRHGGVDEGELRALLALGRRMWSVVGREFPRARAEVALTYTHPSGAFELSGHLDLMAWVGRVVQIGDWKTGHRDADYREQLLGYCVLALTVGAFGIDAAVARALWVRDGDVERHAMAARDVGAWLARVMATIVQWDGRYRAGPHCDHCPRAHECPAGRALVRRDVASIVADGELATLLEAGDPAVDDALEWLGPDELVALLERADLARSRGQRVRDAIRGYVERRGDVVGAGKRLTVVSDERRRVDLLAAFPVLREHGLDDDDLAEVLAVSLAAAERVVAKKAGRGKGAAAARDLVSALAAAGAITTMAARKLITRRA